MFCKKCGNELKEDVRFCPKCGTKVDETNDAIARQDVNNEEKINKGNEFQNADTKKEVETWESNNVKSNKNTQMWKGFAIAGAVLSLCLVVVISSIIIFQRINETKHNDKAKSQTNVADATTSEKITNTENNTAQKSTSQDTKNLSSIFNKYIQYVEQDQVLLHAAAYDVLYINDDAIPEIAIEGTNEADGTGILYYANGQVNYLQLDRLQFFYIKNSGLLCNSEGNMGYYYDKVYSFRTDGVKKIAEGLFGIVDENTITYDSDGNQLNQYQWNGQMVSEDQYQKELNSIFDFSKISYDYYQYHTIEEAVGAVENNTRGNSLYVVPFSNRRYLTQEDLKGLTKQELELARNEIYAQMGYQFTREDLEAYFSSKSWYFGYTSTITDDMLNEFQRANIKLIQSMEEK